MFTSATKLFIQKQTLKTTLIYLVSAVFTALFGGVYELFSHGVYANTMVYAFAFPLVLGVLPFFLLSTALCGGLREEEEPSGSDAALGLYPRPLARYLYHCGVLTLTVGSLLSGVLEIYGTSNILLFTYWIAGPLLLLTAITLYVTGLVRRKGRAF